MLLSRRERLGLSFPKRCSRLSHHLHHALVLFMRQTLEIFRLAVLARTDVSDAWQLVCRVGVLDAVARSKPLRWLAKVLTIVVVQVMVTLGCRDIETIVPLGSGVTIHRDLASRSNRALLLPGNRA